MSNLNRETKNTTLKKKKATPKVYEIISNCKAAGAAISIINMFNVIAHIIPDKTLNEPWNDKDKNEQYKQIEKKLKRLCKLFSRDELKVRWKDESTNSQTISSDFMVIVFTINNEDAFKWVFKDGHFVIERINDPTEDWRVTLAYSEFPNEWMASLFPRSLNIESLDIEQEKQYAKKFPITVIYNPSLRTSEGIEKTIRIVLDNNMKNFYPLFSRWTQQSVQSDRPTLFIDIMEALSNLSEELNEGQDQDTEKEKEKEKQGGRKEAIDKAIENGIDIAKQKECLNKIL